VVRCQFFLFCPPSTPPKKSFHDPFRYISIRGGQIWNIYVEPKKTIIFRYNQKLNHRCPKSHRDLECSIEKQCSRREPPFPGAVAWRPVARQMPVATAGPVATHHPSASDFIRHFLDRFWPS
jgi:hypothetical protein